MNEQLKQLLLKVDKPARYSGGEVNTPIIKKDMPLRFLMCFPDVYEVAHSNLGIKILYYLLNERSDTSCETCYTPWTDMSELLQKNNMPLFSQETHSPMRDFSIVGFSLQYEMSYTNVLHMLHLGNIPLLSAQRGENDPIIVGGGPCSINPYPLVPFFDVFSLGDGEDALNELAHTYVVNKQMGGSKQDFLAKAATIDGMFVPSVPQKKIRRAVIDSLDGAYYPTAVQIPNIEAVHNRAVLEIFRGCTRGCRFCQAGMIYRPVRERTVQTLTRYAKELIEKNGFDEISLSSLSTCDFGDLRGLLKNIKPTADCNRVSISLPSTRVDSFESEFVESARLSSLTFAPEAGTQRLRDVINKNVTEDDIYGSVIKAFQKGYSSVKLYFMIGLPTETQEDIEGIVKIAENIKGLFKKYRNTNKQLSISLSTSTFVPKPFTPFQWEKQISLEEMVEKQEYLKNALRPMRIKYSWHEGKTSQIEAALARGDERMGDVLLHAYQNGCIYDGWSEFFNYESWQKAFEDANVDIARYTDGFSLDETLPWDKIHAGIDKEFLLKERAKAYAVELTSDCRNGCHCCGINTEYPSAFAENCVKNIAAKRKEGEV